MKVAVASENPVKVGAVKKAFAHVWEGDIEIVFQKVSHAKDQPFNDETIEGAKLRALEVITATGADLGVGLEGGIDKTPVGYFVTAWCAIADKDGHVTYGRSFGVPVPDYVVDRIKNEESELGNIIDELLHKKNNKQAEGFFGYATKNVVTRENGYLDMVLAALAPRIHSKFYKR